MSQSYGSSAAAHLNGNAIAMSRHDAPLPAISATVGRNLPTEEELREISASLRGLRYGSVSIVVQDGVIIQIDRVEKRRLRNRRDSAENGR
jgi:hypothetical protein